MSHFSWAQPSYTALLLDPQTHVPCDCDTISKGTQQGFNDTRFLSKEHCYNKERIYHTQISLLSHFPHPHHGVATVQSFFNQAEV